MNNTVKIIFILIIIILVIIGILGSVYYFSQQQAKIKYIRIVEKFNIGTQEDIRMGIEECRVLAAKFPKSKYAPKALLQIGKGYELLYELSKNVDKLDIAEKEYYNVEKLYSGTREAQEALFRIAHINYLRGDYEEAQEKLDYILSKYGETPLRSKIYNEKGYIYLASGAYKKALKFFNMKDNFNTDEAFFGRALCYFKLENYERAISIYEDFIRYRKISNVRKDVVRNFINTAYDYAKKLNTTGEYDRSNLLLSKIIELFPEDNIAENCLYWMGENYYSKKDYRKAIESFNSVLNNKWSGKDADALFKLGITYFELNKFEDALKYFQKIIDNFAANPIYKKAIAWKRQTLREIKYRR